MVSKRKTGNEDEPSSSKKQRMNDEEGKSPKKVKKARKPKKKSVKDNVEEVAKVLDVDDVPDDEIDSSQVNPDPRNSGSSQGTLKIINL